MKKTIIFTSIFAFIFLTLALSVFSKEIAIVEINNQTIKAEVAKNPKEKFQGLSNRKSLPQNSGMLFTFNDYKYRTFIMRDMNFLLDIVWIKDTLVYGCEKNVPIYAENGSFSYVKSKHEVNVVLELNAGKCEEFDIKKGDNVDIKIY